MNDLCGLPGFRLALRDDFAVGYESRKGALFAAACRYQRSGGKPGQVCSPAVHDRLDELSYTASRLYVWCCEWAELGVLPEIDIECPGCLLVAAVLDYCAARESGDQEQAGRQCRRFLSAALVLARSLEDGARC